MPIACVFNEGDLVDAVVPFMGESITDGTLAKFLKSMFSMFVYQFFCCCKSFPALFLSPSLLCMCLDFLRQILVIGLKWMNPLLKLKQIRSA